MLNLRKFREKKTTSENKTGRKADEIQLKINEDKICIPVVLIYLWEARISPEILSLDTLGERRNILLESKLKSWPQDPKVSAVFSGLRSERIRSFYGLRSEKIASFSRLRSESIRIISGLRFKSSSIIFWTQI